MGFASILPTKMEDCPILKLFQYRATLKHLERKERVSIPLEELPGFVRAALLYRDCGPEILYFAEQDDQMHISTRPFNRFPQFRSC